METIYLRSFFENFTKLQSRNIAAFDQESLLAVRTLNILLIGAKGLGAEVAKHLSILSPKNLSIHDNELVQVEDLGSNFLLKENQIQNVTRAEATVKGLKNMSGMDLQIQVYIEPKENFLKDKFDIVIISNYEVALHFFQIALDNEIQNIDQINIGLRKKGINLILCESFSVFGYCFVDCGSSYETKTQGQIKFQTIQKELQEQRQPINVQAAAKTGKRVFTKAKANVKLSLPSEDLLLLELLQTLRQQTVMIGQQSKITQVNLIDAQMIYKQQDYDKMDYGSESEVFDMLKIFDHYGCELPPFVSIFGALASFQVIRIASKLLPLNQVFTYFRKDLLVTRSINNDDIQTRYSYQKKVFGSEAHNIMTQLNIFIPGLGALGCEVSKNFALMGLCTGEDSHLTFTDFDQIELSNLNRQILFSKDNIGKNKASIAALVLKQINPAMNIQAFTQMINHDSLDTFSEPFLKSLDAIVNGLDSIESRRFVHSLCIIHELPFLDAGILKSQAQYGTHIPVESSTYEEEIGGQTDKLFEQVPSCTVRFYPTRSVHCFQWTREIMIELFELSILSFNKVIELTDRTEETKFCSIDDERIKQLLLFNQLLKIIQSDNKELLIFKLALQYFNSYFIDDINQTVESKPQSYIDEQTKVEFWKGKKFPHPLDIDLTDIHIRSFIASFMGIILNILNHQNQQVQDMTEYCKDSLFEFDEKLNHLYETLMKNSNEQFISFNVQHFIQQQVQESSRTMKYLQLQQKIFLDLQVENNNIVKLLKESNSLVELTPITFDKDDFLQLAFIFGASNLRCRNYDIPEVTFQNAIQIGGNIQGQTSFASSIACGFVSLEIYQCALNNKKFISHPKMQGHISIEIPYFAHAYLAKPEVQQTDEEENIVTIPLQGFTKWTQMHLYGDLTISQIQDYLVLQLASEYEEEQAQQFMITDVIVHYPLQRHLYQKDQGQVAFDKSVCQILRENHSTIQFSIIKIEVLMKHFKNLETELMVSQHYNQELEEEVEQYEEINYPTIKVAKILIHIQ